MCNLAGDEGRRETLKDLGGLPGLCGVISYCQHIDDNTRRRLFDA